MIIPEYTNSSPKLFDRVIIDTNAALVNNLSWLNNAFGLSQKIVQNLGTRDTYYPAVYIGSGEYISMLPNDEFGNYSFFEIDDPQLYSNVVRDHTMLTTKGSIIFWINQSSMLMNEDIQANESLKNEILKVLTMPGIIKNGRLTVNKVFTKPENVFNQYSIKQVDTQYLMFPYIGLRFECELKINEKC